MDTHSPPVRHRSALPVVKMVPAVVAWILPVLSILVLLCSSSAHADLGLTCSQHPISSIKRPVLIRSWDFLDKGTGMMVNGRVAYYPRYKQLDYTPRDNPVSTKYKNLDFFYIGGARNSRKDPSLAALYFQRPAVVYMFVNAKGYMPDMPAKGQMPGWKSEGWAYLGPKGKTMTYGLYQKSTFMVTRHVFVFSKRTKGGRLNSIILPHFGWVRRKTKRLMAKGSYHIRVAEADGRASAPPSKFKGLTVKPNARCPDVLHDAWSTMDDNVQDRDSQGRLFGTWHPQWDPCFWCAYGHEHGSAAPFLMDYKPKYGYAEFKNGRGIEPNTGFKDFVFEHEDLIVYLSVHAQTSSLRRVKTDFHTVTVVMKDIATGQLKVEISFKGDFGFLAARKRDNPGDFLPLTRDGIQMKNNQKKRRPFRRNFRTINVINFNRLDNRFFYSYPTITGTYEEWVATLPCSTSAMGGELTFDIQDPITGIRSISSEVPVWLGRSYDKEGFRENLGLKRTVRAKNFAVSADSCGFSKDFKGGYFYTNVYGNKLLPGPGPNAIRQFIEPGFKGTISGKWSLDTQWKGLHKIARNEHFFLQHGYGIDKYVN